MLSSSSESEDVPADGANEQTATKEESEDDREVDPEWRKVKTENEEDEEKKQEDAPWIPIRVTEALQGPKTFKEFMERRRFNFLHMFSGSIDGLGEAVSRMAELQAIKVRVVALDKKRGMNLAEPQPFNDFLELVRTGEFDAAHCGFRGRSFNRRRYREVPGTAPVRYSQWIYGLPSNDREQQAEADLGSLLAIRSVQICFKVNGLEGFLIVEHWKTRVG